MQVNHEKSQLFASTLGEILKDIRSTHSGLSINRLANEYELNKGTLSKLERGNNNCQLITLWLLSEALGVKCSELIKILEEKLGEDFSLLDE